MSITQTLTLAGCTPVPLAHYLKALGVLRLVSEQKDSSAKGRWYRDQFVLESSLDREGLLKFFLEEYHPTPILSPWNADGGFYSGSRPGSRKTLETVEQSKAVRLEPYRLSIAEIRKMLTTYNITEKPKDEEKDKLILACRSMLSEKILPWVDATSVLTADGAKYPPLLGTGGNDGSSDFSKNWMLVLPSIFDLNSGDATIAARPLLLGALFAEASASSYIDAPIGQFLPGAAGGANITSGFKGDPVVNPWDFILMIEGALLFAAASVKRLESSDTGALAYPFCVRQAGVGYASATASDESASRAEMWMPVWNRRAVTLDELAVIFSEGRAQVGSKAARNGVDFARAVTSLGVDRGLDEFQRFGFQVRNGLSYFATPLTRVVARKDASADLLSDIDAWLSRYRSAATKDTAPASARRALGTLEAAIVDLCISSTPARLLRVFLALGQCQATAARSLKWAKESYLQPLQGLKKAWLQNLPHHDLWNDPQTGAEFRLAASLASLNQSYAGKWLPFRCHLEAVESKPFGYGWADNPTNDVLWSQAALPSVLNAIMARRLLKAPDEDKLGGIPASLADIKAFIEHRTDDALLADLLWSMSLIDWREEGKTLLTHQEHQPTPPTLYALLKLCFPPAKKKLPEDILPVPVVPAIHRHAATGQGGQAATLALRRLRASGYQPKLKALPCEGEVATRTAAALLFPIADKSLEALRNHLTRPDLLKEAPEETPRLSN